MSRNKHVILAMTILGIAFMPNLGCKKLNKLVQFNIDYRTEFTIPSSSGINLPFNVLSPDVTTDSEASFRENDTRKDLINAINLTELKLTIKSPSNGNFSFLKSAQVFINAPNLDEKEVASIDNIPENIGMEISLNPSGSDLAPYIKADKFTLRVKVVTDEFITRDHTVEIYSKFHIEGKLIDSDK